MIRTSRRHFLLGSASAAAGVLLARGLPSAEASAAGGSWKMRLSTSTVQFLHLTIEQACQRISQLGFEAIDIWSAHAGCPHLDDVANRLGAKKLVDLLAANRLALCSFSVYRGGYPKYAELLGGAGGGLAIHGSAGPCPPKELTARMRDLLEKLKPETELAEKYNSFVAIENHGHALLDSPDSFKAFVDLNKSSRLGIALAPYHLQSQGASVEQVISTCGRQLFYFYAWQKGRDTDQLPGHGPTDFKPWLQALAKINYQGYVNPFMHGDIKPDEMSAALKKARAYLIECARSVA